MNDCVFCKIANHEIPAHVVYEDDVCIAFLDRSPVHKGHLLIIPKSHHVWMYDTPDELMGPLFVVAKKLMIAMKAGLNAEYVQMGVVGLEIPHFHIHLIPGLISDGLPPTFKVREHYIQNEEETIAANIKNAFYPVGHSEE